LSPKVVLDRGAAEAMGSASQSFRRWPVKYKQILAEIVEKHCSDG